MMQASQLTGAIMQATSTAYYEARRTNAVYSEYDAWEVGYRGTSVAEAREIAERAHKERKANEKRIATERRIVRHFIRTAKAAGFVVHSVWDGEERVKVKNETEAMDAVFSVDESSVLFAKTSEPERKRESLLVVLGNGCDCLADMSCGRADWDAVVETSSRYIDTQYE